MCGLRLVTRTMNQNNGLSDIDVRLATLNVRGARNNEKRRAIIRWALDNNIDILCAQETYCTHEFIDTFNRDWNGHVLHSYSDSTHSRGVCIMIRKKLDYKLINSHRSDDGRMVLINISINDLVITIANIYAPNNVNERNQFFKRMSRWVHRHSNNNENLIIMGDFNTVTSEIDRSSRKIDSTCKSFKDVKSYLNLDDKWRDLNPDKIEYTWFNPGNLLQGSRIDYILTSKITTNYVKEITIINAPVPDHRAVLCNLNYFKNKRGQGYWKLNTSILNEQGYKQGVHGVLHNTIVEYNDVLCKRKLWDLCKIRIKEFSIKYCIRRNKLQKDLSKEIQKSLSMVESKITVNPEQIMQLKEEHSALKQKLDKLYMNRAKGYQVRSRAKYIEDGEKSTGYFLKLEKQRQTYNKIDCLENDNGERLNSDNMILNECHNFYSNLYTSEKPTEGDIDIYLNNVNLEKHLTLDDRYVCEGLVSKAECYEALKKMKSNKSPGLDGLPVEFYETFWDEINHLLIDVFNESFNEKELPESQKLSVLSLIFKKGDRHKLVNYRPISLSTIDYKILAFTLALRLQNILPKIINNDQAAYVKGRFIGNNIRLVEDIIEYANKYNTKGILMFLDFKKCFDSIEHKFILATLRKFNFGPQFIQWIETLYNNPKATVKNNGWMSEDFDIQRGIRQGCPISALLFLLVSEILAIKIRTDKKIEGYKINTANGTYEIRIAQYADDSTIFLKDETQIEKVINIIDAFGNVAGLRLNLNKTEAIWLGREKNRIDQPANLKWCTKHGTIRYLGIHIGHDRDQCKEMNWYQKLINLEKLLETWKKRDLTIFGKVSIIKSLAIPKILYSAVNTAIPDNFTNKINKILYGFIWNKTERIKRNTLIGDVDMGGVGMIDIDTHFSALQTTYVKRILYSDSGSWTHLSKEYIHTFGKHITMSMNYINEAEFPLLNQIPEFYKQLILSWNKTKIQQVPDNRDILIQQPLWGNRVFKIKMNKKDTQKQTIYFPSWIASGLLQLSDLKIINGKLDEKYLYQKVHNKSNIFSEIYIIKQILKPYRNMIVTHIPNQTEEEERIFPDFKHNGQTIILETSTTKSLYKILRANKFEKPRHESRWKTKLKLENDYDFTSTYINKIKGICDKKIAEFNYKVITNTLTCGNYLSKWKEEYTPECKVCGQIEDPIHLFYNCIHVNWVWKKLNRLLDTQLIVKDVVLGTNRKDIDYVISVISFLIYKEWIICNDKGTSRKDSDLKLFLKAELCFRIKVYALILKHESMKDLLEMFYNAL